MNLEHYAFTTTEDMMVFEFDSTGPKGVIKKSIQFSRLQASEIPAFNLAFGDLDEHNDLNDRIVSDNGDRQKILSTIAKAVLLFLGRYPNVAIYAEGSTSARTRLYQIGIATHWDQIRHYVNVFGYKDNTWVPFELNINFETFSCFSSKSVILHQTL